MGSGMYALAGLPGPFIHIVRSEFFYLQKMGLDIGSGLELPYLLYCHGMSGPHHYHQGSILQFYLRRTFFPAALSGKGLGKELGQSRASRRYASVPKLHQSLRQGPEVLILPAVRKEQFLSLRNLFPDLSDHRILTLADD